MFGPCCTLTKKDKRWLFIFNCVPTFIVSLFIGVIMLLPYHVIMGWFVNCD